MRRGSLKKENRLGREEFAPWREPIGRHSQAGARADKLRPALQEGTAHKRLSLGEKRKRMYIYAEPGLSPLLSRAGKTLSAVPTTSTRGSDLDFSEGRGAWERKLPGREDPSM